YKTVRRRSLGPLGLWKPFGRSGRTSDARRGTRRRRSGRSDACSHFRAIPKRTLDSKSNSCRSRSPVGRLPFAARFSGVLTTHQGVSKNKLRGLLSPGRGFASGRNWWGAEQLGFFAVEGTRKAVFT